MLDWRDLGSLSHLPRKKHVRRKMWKSRVPVHRGATGRTSPSVVDLCSESPSLSECAQCDRFSPLERLDSACAAASSVTWPGFCPLPKFHPPNPLAAASVVLCVMGVCTVPDAPADSRKESGLKWSLRGELGEMIRVDMED